MFEEIVGYLGVVMYMIVNLDLCWELEICCMEMGVLVIVVFDFMLVMLSFYFVCLIVSCVGV